MLTPPPPSPTVLESPVFGEEDTTTRMTDLAVPIFVAMNLLLTGRGKLVWTRCGEETGADMLNSLYQGFSALLKKQIEKRYILECLDLILLTLDEVFDDGIILESNPDAIVDLVGVRSESDVPLSEQTITQAFLKVRNKMDKFMK